MVLKKFGSNYCSAGFIQWWTVKVYKLTMESYSLEILSYSLSRQKNHSPEIIESNCEVVKCLGSTIVSSLLLVLKWKASRELLRFQKRFWISLSFTISGMHLTIEVSYAGFAKFFCSYDNVLVHGFVPNKVTMIIFSEGL